MNKVFFDTAPFIYLIEKHPTYYYPLYNFLLQSVESDFSFRTSVISILEYNVKPERDNRIDLIQNFEGLLQELDCAIIPIDTDIAKYGAKLRAKYRFLKSIDALQIATAIHENCELFLSNDKQLLKIQEIKVVIMETL